MFRSHFGSSRLGSSRRPTLWVEFPLTFLPVKVCLVEATSSFVVSMVQGVNNVSKDGWSSVSYGWTCGYCGLERSWFSSKCCRRCGAPKLDGSPSAPGAAAQVPRRTRKRGARPASKSSAPPEVNLAKMLDGLQENEHFKGTEVLAAMEAKVEQARETDKLAKHQARTPEVAVHSVSSALPNRKATLAKTQAKVFELEAAAKAAVEAVEEAEQQVAKELSRQVKTSDPVTHLQKSLGEAFHSLPGSVEAQPLLSQLELAFTGTSSMLAAATPTPPATDARNNDIDMQPDKVLSVEAVARACARSLEGLPEDESEAKKQKFVEYVEQERRVWPPQAPLQHHPALAACRRPQARDHCYHPLQRYWLEKDFQFGSHIKKQPGQLPQRTSQRGNLDS